MAQCHSSRSASRQAFDKAWRSNCISQHELHLALDGAQDSDLLTEGIEEVSEIQVGELPIEAFQNQVQARDHIAAELQRKGCLNGATTALERRPVYTCMHASLTVPHDVKFTLHCFEMTNLCCLAGAYRFLFL